MFSLITFLIMDILPLLVEWEDGSVSDIKRFDVKPLFLVLFGIQKIPLSPFLTDNAPSLEEWVSQNSDCHITLGDLFDYYWKISFTLKELGLEDIYVFSHTPDNYLLNVSQILKP